VLRADEYYVANGDRDFAYIHLSFRIGTGRSGDEQTTTFALMKDIVLKHYAPLMQRQAIALSFELSELPPEHRHNANNIREYINR